MIDPKVHHRLKKIAQVMDNSIRLPGTSYRIGLDGIIGLIPGFGDFAGALIASYVVFEAARMGAEKSLLARMAFNVALEWIVGSIPLIGDIFDFTFKANLRNVRLIERAVLDPRKASRSNRLFLAVLVLALIILPAAMIYATIVVGRLIVTAFSSAG